MRFTSLSPPQWASAPYQAIEPTEKTAPPAGVSKKTMSARMRGSSMTGRVASNSSFVRSISGECSSL